MRQKQNQEATHDGLLAHHADIKATPGLWSLQDVPFRIQLCEKRFITVPNKMDCVVEYVTFVLT